MSTEINTNVSIYNPPCTLFFMRAIYFLYIPSLFALYFFSPFTIQHKGFILFTSLPSPIPSRAYTHEHYITYTMAALYPLYYLSNALSFPFGFIPKTYLLYPFWLSLSLTLSWLYNPFIQWLYINLCFTLCLCLILCPCLSFALLCLSIPLLVSVAVLLIYVSYYPPIRDILYQAIILSFLSLSLLSLDV